MDDDSRAGLTHDVRIGGMKGYITANYNEDMELREVFVHGFGKLGSATQGWTDAFCIMLSLGMQNGLALSQFVPRLSQMKFEPNGETSNPDIPFCYSIPDYICRWITHHFGTKRLKEELKTIHTEMERV